MQGRHAVGRRSRGVPGIAAGVLAAVLVTAIGLDARPAAAQPREAVVIPSFGDPKRRVERPPAGAVPAIRFVTTDDFPPFNFIGRGGRLTGFNVDLARAICAELGIPCTIQTRNWDDLLEALRSGKADAIIAGIAITAEAREELDFSSVYLRSPGRFVVRRGGGPPDISPRGLEGRTLAVVAGTAHEAFVEAFFPAALKPYPTAEAASGALVSGEADALFGDGLQLSFWLQSEAAGGCCAFAGGPYLESRFFGEGYAIAIPRGRTELRRALDAGLEAVYEDGIYPELYLRYFPVGFF